MNVTTTINHTALLIAALGTLLATGDSLGEQVLRPTCNVRVETYSAPKRMSVPAGTVFYVCPDEKSAVDRKIAITATPKLTGEIDGWLEYEFRPGVPVYARNPKAVSDVGTDTAVANNQVQVANGASATSGDRSPGGAAAMPTPVIAASGKTEIIIPSGLLKTHSCQRSMTIDAYLDESFDIGDDAKTKQFIVDVASQIANACSQAGSFEIKLQPNTPHVRKYGGNLWAKGFVDRIGSTNQVSAVRDFLNWEAPRRAQLAQIQAQEAEEASKRRAAELVYVDFLRRTGVEAYADASELVANPFVFEGKTILVEAALIEMLSRSEAAFRGFKSSPFVVTKVPSTRFTEPGKYYSIVVRVEGIKSRALPGPYGFGGDKPILHVSYVGADDKSLGGGIVMSDRWQWYEARIKEAKGR